MDAPLRGFRDERLPGLQSSYRYDPYGNPTQAAGPVSSPYRYAGAAYDVGPGLTYDRARYYDASTGRFLSKDPVGGGYAYAGDNPVNARDPSGRHPLWGGVISWATGEFDLDTGTWYAGGTGIGGVWGPGSGGGATGISERCVASILLYVAGLALGFLGIYMDMNAIKLGLETAYAGWGLDFDQIVTGLAQGKIDVLGMLTLFLDVASYLFMDWTKTASFWHLLWTGTEDAAKLTPPGVAIEAGFLTADAILGIPGVMQDCAL